LARFSSNFGSFLSASVSLYFLVCSCPPVLVALAHSIDCSAKMAHLFLVARYGITRREKMHGLHLRLPSAPSMDGLHDSVTHQVTHLNPVIRRHANYRIVIVTAIILRLA
jgi:hypothetical protein